ncbi:MAG TPA: 3'(2'),5'-bisphosphate nucleotidase CysQ [Nitrospirota bacterium]
MSALREAGTAILKIYGSEFSVTQKADRSPVTAADKISHEILSGFLRKHYSFPILSEEGKDIPYEERKQWDTFWLVDPLDGTKEFINRNGEFTVNVALIRQGKPVMGIIYVPVKRILYYAVKGKGSFKRENGHEVRLPLDLNRRGVTVVGSRSHGTPEFDAFIQQLRSKHDALNFVSAGSSLKFCLVAEGSADLYPRLGPTMEWDTAAGQMIVEEAGGFVLKPDSDHPLQYNKTDLRNPHFIVKGRNYCERGH